MEGDAEFGHRRILDRSFVNSEYDVGRWTQAVIERELATRSERAEQRGRHAELQAACQGETGWDCWE